jgi:hypothetical protein
MEQPSVQQAFFRYQIQSTGHLSMVDEMAKF